MALDVRGMTPLLLVFDMPTSIAFYRDMLGFEVVQTSAAEGDRFEWALLRLNGAELMLNTTYENHERPRAPDPARVGSHADTALYFGCPDVDAAYAHLRARGVGVEQPNVTSYGFKRMSLKDPDGYYLCFHWPVAEQADA